MITLMQVLVGFLIAAWGFQHIPQSPQDGYAVALIGGLLILLGSNSI